MNAIQRGRARAMTGSFPAAVRGGWRPGARFLFRSGRRTLVESLYLLTAPVTAVTGLLLVLGGLCAGTVALLRPGRSPVPAGVLAPARWSADLERWRIAWVRPPAAGAAGTGRRPGQAPAAADPGYGSAWRTRWWCSRSRWSPPW